MFVKFYLTLVLLFVPVTVSAQLFEPPIDNLFSRLTNQSGIDFIKGDSKNPDSPTVCVAPPANLISWYRGEGNANDSQGANNGILGSSAIFTAGKVGQAFQTIQPNGSTVLIPDSASLDFTNARISTNNALGIKLDNRRGGNAGLINDLQDADSGANELQNYPALIVTSSSGGNTAIQGTLNSAPFLTFTLEFFSSQSCGASGNGEGETFLGSSNTTTDAGGIVGFTANLPVAVANGRFITATATDASGNTSEFSGCQIVSQTFEISGRTTSGGQPLANVRMRLTNPTIPAANRSILTDNNGDYSFDFLPVADYTLTVSHPNHTFTPPRRTYPSLTQNQITQNFTAVQPTFSLRGKALIADSSPNIAAEIGNANFAPSAQIGNFALRGVMFNLSDATNATIVNDRFDNYNFDNLPPGNYLVTPSKPNYVFTPPLASIVIGSGSQIVDFAGESLGLSTLTGRIIYESRGGDIQAMNANGSGVVTLAARPGKTNLRYSSPNLSANGSRAVYARHRGNSASQSGINTINADGSDVIHVLTGAGLSAPSFSPDGIRIAFIKSTRIPRSSSLVVMNANGSNSVTLLSGTQTIHGTLSWSPDGARLALIRDEGFVTRNDAPDANGTDRELITIQADGQVLLVINDEFDGNKIDWRASTAFRLRRVRLR